MVTVAKMPQTITFEGKTYGPSSGPLEVPAELAAALGLSVISASGTVQSGAISEQLSASQHLTDQYKTNLEGLLELLAPFAGKDELPQDVLRGLIDFVKKSEAIFMPIAGDGGTEESGLEAMQRIVDERNSLRDSVERLQGIINVGKPANEQLMREKADLQTKLAAAEAANAEYLEYIGPLLPQGYPDRKLLMDNGHITEQHVEEATDDELKAIDGIADKKLEAIRKVTPYKAPASDEESNPDEQAAPANVDGK